jgi:hypothetical protein
MKGKKVIREKLKNGKRSAGGSGKEGSEGSEIWWEGGE